MMSRWSPLLWCCRGHWFLVLRFVPLIREVPIQIFISGSRKLTANCIATSRFAVPDLFSHCSFFVVVVGTPFLTYRFVFDDDLLSISWWFHWVTFYSHRAASKRLDTPTAHPSPSSSVLLRLICLWIENKENRSECRDIQLINKWINEE